MSFKCKDPESSMTYGRFETGHCRISVLVKISTTLGNPMVDIKHQLRLIPRQRCMLYVCLYLEFNEVMIVN